MNLPSSGEYVAAVQNPQVAFRDDPDLRAATIELRMGLPKAYSGGFTVTFHAIAPGSEWAVRCFTRHVTEVHQRYDAISRFSKSSPGPLFARAELVRAGMLVGGHRYDIIKMEWLRGVTLDAYVRAKIADRAALLRLAAGIVTLGETLERLQMAHGDLQHGNILVTEAGELRLVDYDDLFLPELAHLVASSGVGHENYQHTQRTGADFDAKMDRFSLAVLYVSLEALAREPQLFDRFDGGDECILFRKVDYAEPGASAAFDAVARIPELRGYVDRLTTICRAPYAAVPPLAQFLDGSFTADTFVFKAKPAAPPPVQRKPRAVRPAPASAVPVAGASLSAASAGVSMRAAARARARGRAPRTGLAGAVRSMLMMSAGAIAIGVVAGVGYLRLHPPHALPHVHERVVRHAPHGRGEPSAPPVGAPVAAAATTHEAPESATGTAAPVRQAVPGRAVASHVDDLTAAAAETARPVAHAVPAAITPAAPAPASPAAAAPTHAGTAKGAADALTEAGSR